MQADISLLRDLIDRDEAQNLCALRPGRAVHVHALERLLDEVLRPNAVPLSAKRLMALFEEWDQTQAPTFAHLPDKMAAWLATRLLAEGGSPRKAEPTNLETKFYGE